MVLELGSFKVGKEMRIKIKSNDGFTLIEVMIAILILAVGMMAMALLQVTAIRGGSFARGGHRVTLGEQAWGVSMSVVSYTVHSL